MKDENRISVIVYNAKDGKVIPQQMRVQTDEGISKWVTIKIIQHFELDSNTTLGITGEHFIISYVLENEDDPAQSMRKRADLWRVRWPDEDIYYLA